MEYQKRRRRNHPRPRTEDELWPSPQPRCRRSSSPMIPPDHWRRPHKGPVLKSASLPNSFYWACWVWVCSHLQWKEPPKSGPHSNNFRIFLYLKFENQLKGLYGKIEVCIASPFCFLFERLASSCLNHCSTSSGFLYWAFYMKEQYSTMCFSGVDEKNERIKKKI